MRKKLEPRFPESLQKLKCAIRAYGNNAELARRSGLSVATITNLTKEKDSTRFPWAQTVEVLWQVLSPPEVIPQRATQLVSTDKKQAATSQVSGRRTRRYGKSSHVRASVRLIARPVRVQIGKPF